MIGVVLVVCWLLLVFALSLTGGQKDEKGGTRRIQIGRVPLLLIGIGLAPFLFILANDSVLTVPPAQVAVVYDPLRGGIQRDVLPEGFHIVMPWWETQVFSQQTQEYTMSASKHASGDEASLEDDSIRCQTNEGMNVQIDCTILFHVDPKDANDLWKKIGEDYVRLIVRPYAQNLMRMVVSRYSVEEVYTTRRKQIEMEIFEAMKPMFAEKGMLLEQILIRNVQYGNPAFADAISAKQVAQQQVQTEKEKLNRARIEKETTIAEARGEAEAIGKRGATLRQNPEVVQYEFVQKVAPRLRSVYLPASALPVLRGGH